jgi:hypothetical protein
MYASMHVGMHVLMCLDVCIYACIYARSREDGNYNGKMFSFSVLILTEEFVVDRGSCFALGKDERPL